MEGAEADGVRPAGRARDGRGNVPDFGRLGRGRRGGGPRAGKLSGGHPPRAHASGGWIGPGRPGRAG